MTNRKEFTRFLWESLDPMEYVWLNPSARLRREDMVPEILIASNNVQDLLTRMRQFPEVRACQASFRFHGTLAVFSFDGWTYSINFVHKMVSKNLFFLAEETVFALYKGYIGH